MMSPLKALMCTLFLCCYILSAAQRYPDQVFYKNIHTIKFNPFGDQVGYPIIALNSNDKLELNFDDMDGGVKYYYYSFQLCNSDWTPVQLSYFDFVKGFTQVRINTYRQSSLSLTRYTHYQAMLPDRNCIPTKAGNYILKVFLDGDTTRLAFTRRFLVVDNRLPVAAQVQQPYAQQYFRTHHKLQVHVSTKNVSVTYPQQQIKLVILQNYRWDNCLKNINPTFFREEMVQYTNEIEMLMSATKEWRWLNLRSFRLLGDRVAKQENTDTSFNLFVQEEKPRIGQQYFFFNDQNGRYVNETTENINPYWNADYASVHFRFMPPGKQAYNNKELFIIGEITNYGMEDSARMRFNEKTGSYETTLYLKQGYYDYMYATRDHSDRQIKFNTELTENNSWETENVYLVLVYYRELGGRYDQLLGIAKINSQFNRPGRY
jgi:Domain of unknown function (DUF5103)